MSNVGGPGGADRPRGMDELILGFPLPPGADVGIERASTAPVVPKSPELQAPGLLAVGRGETALKVGARGAAVRGLQEALIALGKLPPGSADGVFGRGTERAVAAFQKQYFLDADGKVGRQTLRQLDHALEAVRSGAGGTTTPRPGTGGTGGTGGTSGTTPTTPLPAAVTGLSAQERAAFDRISDRLFLGARPGRFDVTITDADAVDCLDTLDSLPPKSYEKVIEAMLATKAHAGEGSLLDTLVERGVADVINFALSSRFYLQLLGKLTPVGKTPDSVIDRLIPIARRPLMAHLRAAGIR